jgi:hypothetical protein
VIDVRDPRGNIVDEKAQMGTSSSRRAEREAAFLSSVQPPPLVKNMYGTFCAFAKLREIL